MNALDFTFSDLVAGYVTGYDQAADSFTLETSDGRPYQVGLTPNTYAEVIRNLGSAMKPEASRLMMPRPSISDSISAPRAAP